MIRSFFENFSKYEFLEKPTLYNVNDLKRSLPLSGLPSIDKTTTFWSPVAFVLLIFICLDALGLGGVSRILEGVLKTSLPCEWMYFPVVLTVYIIVTYILFKGLPACVEVMVRKVFQSGGKNRKSTADIREFKETEFKRLDEERKNRNKHEFWETRRAFVCIASVVFIILGLLVFVNDYNPVGWFAHTTLGCAILLIALCYFVNPLPVCIINVTMTERDAFCSEILLPDTLPFPVVISLQRDRKQISVYKKTNGVYARQAPDQTEFIWVEGENLLFANWNTHDFDNDKFKFEEVFSNAPFSLSVKLSLSPKYETMPKELPIDFVNDFLLQDKNAQMSFVKTLLMKVYQNHFTTIITNLNTLCYDTQNGLIPIAEKFATWRNQLNILHSQVEQITSPTSVEYATVCNKIDTALETNPADGYNKEYDNFLNGKASQYTNLMTVPSNFEASLLPNASFFTPFVEMFGIINKDLAVTSTYSSLTKWLETCNPNKVKDIDECKAKIELISEKLKKSKTDNKARAYQLKDREEKNDQDIRILTAQELGKVAQVAFGNTAINHGPALTTISSDISHLAGSRNMASSEPKQVFAATQNVTDTPDSQEANHEEEL